MTPAQQHRQDRMDMARRYKDQQQTLEAVIDGETTSAIIDVLGVCPRKVCGHSSEVHTVSFRADQMAVLCANCTPEQRTCFAWHFQVPAAVKKVKP